MATSCRPAYSRCSTSPLSRAQATSTAVPMYMSSTHTCSTSVSKYLQISTDIYTLTPPPRGERKPTSGQVMGLLMVASSRCQG